MRENGIEEEGSMFDLLEFLQFCPQESDGLDGIWHPQTQSIAKQLGVSKFDINRWWCLTPSDWHCPACGRKKSEIARANQHNELTCHLVEHHDHMDRYIEKLLVEKIGKSDEFLATLDSERFAKRAAPAISAFDPTVICEDCNNADTKAKKAVAAHTDFSFTVGDMRKFVMAAPNESHKINKEQLCKVWKQRERELRLRFLLAEKIVGLAASNTQWYEEADQIYHAEQIERRASTLLIPLIHSPYPLVRLSQFEEISAPKPVRTTNLRGWRKNKKLCSEVPPTPNDVLWTETRYRKMLESVPQNWSCDWCDRTKIEIIRPSKESAWSIGVRGVWVSNNDSSKRTKASICQDCADVRIQISKEAKVKPDLVEKSHVMSIIRARPHSQHQLEPDTKTDKVIEILALRAHRIGNAE